MERDEETGLEYHKARYYISWLGRWMNCDPIGISDGVNVYAYCRNNPIMSTDRSGMSGDPPDFDSLKKNIEELYNKSKDEKLSVEDRNVASAKMVTEMDNLINAIDAIKDKSIKISFDSELFYSFLTAKGLITDTKKTKEDYERGCIGITMVLTGKSAEELKNNAKYKDFHAASKKGFSKMYAIQFHDAEKYYQSLDPDTKRFFEIEIEKLKNNPKLLKEANEKASLILSNSKKSESINLSQEEINAYFVNLVWEQMSAGDDYKKNADGTVDISGWDFKNPFRIVFDFGYYYKPNAILHANQGNIGGSMEVYISNRGNFERIEKFSYDFEWRKGAVPIVCPCIGSLEFNQQAYGGY